MYRHTRKTPEKGVAACRRTRRTQTSTASSSATAGGQARAGPPTPQAPRSRLAGHLHAPNCSCSARLCALVLRDVRAGFGERAAHAGAEVQRCGADLSELRQKFAEDKRKIAELKAARRFKPY
jgi:hypothetical protein